MGNKTYKKNKPNNNTHENKGHNIIVKRKQ